MYYLKQFIQSLIELLFCLSSIQKSGVSQAEEDKYFSL